MKEAKHRRSQNRARLGVQIWLVYKANGKALPAAWVARAVGVSPTTMTKYLRLYCAAFTARKGRTENGWNWSRASGSRMLVSMDRWNTIRSNGQLVTFDEDQEPDGLDPDHDYTMNFSEAMETVDEGIAVSRLPMCQRVIFKGPDGKRYVGFSDRLGNCTATSEYVPTKDDLENKGWVIDAHVAQLA